MIGPTESEGMISWTPTCSALIEEKPIGRCLAEVFWPRTLEAVKIGSDQEDVVCVPEAFRPPAADDDGEQGLYGGPHSGFSGQYRVIPISLLIFSQIWNENKEYPDCPEMG
jgi:hypothetical protein